MDEPRTLTLRLLIPLQTADGNPLSILEYEKEFELPEELQPRSSWSTTVRLNGGDPIPLDVPIGDLVGKPDCSGLVAEFELPPVIQGPRSQFEVVRDASGDVVGMRSYAPIHAQGSVAETHEVGRQ